jgi:hypothetical protein
MTCSLQAFNVIIFGGTYIAFLFIFFSIWKECQSFWRISFTRPPKTGYNPKETCEVPSIKGKKMEFKKVGQRNMMRTNIQSHEVPELNQTYCPNCNAGPMDGVTGANIEEQPSVHFDAPIKHQGFNSKKVFPNDGCPTLCSYCGELLVYHKVDNALTLSLPTQNEIADFKSNSQMWTLICNMQKRVRKDAEEARLRGDKSYARTKRTRF